MGAMLRKLAVAGTVFTVLGACESSSLVGATSNPTEHHSLTFDASLITSVASNSSSYPEVSTIFDGNATTSILRNKTATSEVVDDAAQNTSTSGDIVSSQASQSRTSALSSTSKVASTTTASKEASSKDISTSITTLATTKQSSNISNTSETSSAPRPTTSQPRTTFPSSPSSSTISTGQDFRTYASRPTTTSPTTKPLHHPPTTTLNFTCPPTDIKTSGACADRFSCLYPHPDYCDAFIKCVVNPDGKTSTPQIVECPEGFGWDDGRKMCDPDIACEVATNSTELSAVKRTEGKSDAGDGDGDWNGGEDGDEDDKGDGGRDEQTSQRLANASLSLARAVREIFEGAVGD